MSFRFSSWAIERPVNAAEDRGTLRRRASAGRDPRRRLHALPPRRVRESRAAATRCPRRARREPGGRSDAARPRAAWDAALRGGVESVVCDLKNEPGFARALADRADVVLESFRPGRRSTARHRPGRRARVDGLLLDHGLRSLRARTPRVPDTTSTTSAGPGRSRTRPRTGRRCRSPISRRARSEPSSRSSPLCSSASAPARAHGSPSR